MTPEEFVYMIGDLREECSPRGSTVEDMFFQKLAGHAADEYVLGEEFVKLASSCNMDPWDMALEVGRNLGSIEVHSQVEDEEPLTKIAQFYMDWARGMEKKAVRGIASIGKGILGKVVGKGATKATKKITETSPKVLREASQSMPAIQRSAGKDMVGTATIPGRVRGVTKPEGALATKVTSGTGAELPSGAVPAPTGAPVDWTNRLIGGGTLAAGLGVPAYMMTSGAQPAPYPGGYGY